MTAIDLMNEPIHPTRVLPTEADVADALVQHETSGMCRYGRTCGTCDCGRSSLNAKGLAEHDAMELDRARAVLALFAGQPTVAQVKAEALREESHYLRERISDATAARNRFDSDSQQWAEFDQAIRRMAEEANRLSLRADRIESEG